MSLFNYLKGIFGRKKAAPTIAVVATPEGPKAQTRINPLVMRGLWEKAQPTLSGPEIANARINGSRSTLPTLKRIRNWRRKQKVPAHVGNKQLAKALLKEGL